LAIVKAEQDRVKAEITQASKLTTVADIDEEAERVADSLVDLGERLATTKDPAVLREMLHQFVDKIVCRWEVVPGRLHGTHRFVDGDVVLSEQGGFSVLQVVDASSGPPTHRKASAGSGRWATTGPKSRLWLAPA
jgi:hypothetical protein